MELSNVYMWDSKGWRKITAEEAEDLHPGGTVSVESGLFMCGYCNQHVIFTDGEVRKRYFRHKKENNNVYCPEHTSSKGMYTPTFKEDETKFALKLYFDTAKNDIQFKMGIRNILEEDNYRIDIKPLNIERNYIYNSDRVSNKGISYVDVGCSPSKSYIVKFKSSSQEKQVNVIGVREEGSVFDSKTMKMLPINSNVQVGVEYYILIKSFLSRTLLQGVVYNEYHLKNGWYLYKVKANRLSKDGAKLFMTLLLRLSESSSDLTVVWPPYTIREENIIYDDEEVYINSSDEDGMKVKTFPYVHTEPYNTNSAIFRIFPRGRQQIIASGRTSVLSSLYLVKNFVSGEMRKSELIVEDGTDKEIMPGKYSDLPAKRRLIIKLAFDGYIVVEEDGHITNKKTIKAKQLFDLSGINYGQTIKIFQGIDCIWTAYFENKMKLIQSHINTINEEVLIRKLNKIEGEKIKVPHAVRVFISYLGNYPLLKNWLYIQARKGYIYDKAWKILKKTILDERGKSKI